MLSVCFMEIMVFIEIITMNIKILHFIYLVDTAKQFYSSLNQVNSLLII